MASQPSCTDAGGDIDQRRHAVASTTPLFRIMPEPSDFMPSAATPCAFARFAVSASWERTHPRQVSANNCLRRDRPNSRTPASHTHRRVLTTYCRRLSRARPVFLPPAANACLRQLRRTGAPPASVRALVRGGKTQAGSYNPVGNMMRRTGEPLGPDMSGKKTRWVAGSTATECELLPGWSWPMSATPDWLMSKTVRSPLSAAT